MAGQEQRSQPGENHGFALISVLLVVMVFFIIAVSISTFVVLEARAYSEREMNEMSNYMADAGLKLANSKVMYRFFLRNIYDPAMEYTYSTDLLPSFSSDYTASIIINIYNLQALPVPVDIYYNYENMISCTANIYDSQSSVLLAQRVLFADIYLGDRLSNPSAHIPDGLIKSKVKRFYDKNR